MARSRRATPQPERTSSDIHPRQLALQAALSEEDLRRNEGLIPDAFPDGEGQVPNNPLIVTGLESMFKGGGKARALTSGWRASETGQPVYAVTDKRGGRIRVYPRLQNDPSEAMPTTDSLWDIVEGLSAFTADVALAVLAQLCEPATGEAPSNPLTQSVRIDAKTIMRYKGIQRYGESARNLEQRIADEMQRLQTLSFDLEKQPGVDPDTGTYSETGNSWKEDRLFDIVAVTRYRQPAGQDREQIEVAWMVRVGQWAQWWFNPQASIWLARMARALLELDHRPNSGPEYLAKKLGQRLVLMAQAIRRRGSLEIRIDGLLEKIGELPLPEERGQNWAHRIRARFDEALLGLQEAGIFESVVWPEGFAPGDVDHGRGWLQRWLESKVRITLPENAPILPDPETHRPRSEMGGRQADGSFSGALLRSERMQRNWKQADLARKLGISTTWLSQIENGRKIPSDALKASIEAWMQNSPLAP